MKYYDYREDQWKVIHIPLSIIVYHLGVGCCPKVKRKVFWRKKKFEKLLFEVFPDEAVDDKVDGGVKHESQLVDRGDRQPQLPAK